MAGLVRKKVRVRSKKGKTYMRSTMVRSDNGPMSLGQFAKRHGARFAAHGVATGMINGAALQRGLHGNHSGARQAVGMRLAGLAGVIAEANSRGGKARIRDLQRLSTGGKAAVVGAHLAAHLAGAYGGYKAANRFTR